MDALGARHLAARLRAGVRVGTTIVLDGYDPGNELHAGDRGVVLEITLDGVLVEWERGRATVVDPATMSYHTLAAA